MASKACFLFIRIPTQRQTCFFFLGWVNRGLNGAGNSVLREDSISSICQR